MASDLRPGRIGYRIVRPPGWVRVALDEPMGAAVAELTELVVRNAPAQNRREAAAFFERMIGDAIRDASENGGQDLYLPTELVDGLPLSISIVVAVSPPRGSTSASDSLLAFASGDDTAVAATVGHQLAVRRYVDVAAERDAQGRVEQPASRRITFLVVPPGQDRLMLITASILRLDVEDDGKILEALEFLFDAMVSTLRFDEPPLRTTTMIEDSA